MIDRNGYTLYYRPDHPFCNSNNYIQDHRLVYEHYFKILFDEDIYIPKELEIHHIDKNIQNNSLINLEPITKSSHTKIHNPKKDYFNVVCSICGCTETYIHPKTGHEEWFDDEINGWKCKKCYMRKYNKEIRKIRRKSKYKLMST
jgi:hypothetical protein